MTWHAEPACSGPDRELFFAADGETFGEHRRREASAKVICAGCPVRVSCLCLALTSRSEFGVWGGFGEAELRKMRGARPRWAAAA
jgi:WhiB family redox-sensing transcriptional regulator